MESVGPNDIHAPAVNFSAFKEEIDNHYDRRERIIKASRDVTALSKKMIFSLLRTPIPSGDAQNTAIPAGILSEVSKYEKQIKELLQNASVELQRANAWRYQRNISGGMQEYVEALTLRFYLEHRYVPNWTQTQALVGPIELTMADYILGIADLTGELMRRAIAALASPSPEALDYTRTIARCLRDLTLQYRLLDTSSHAEGLRELSKKIEVMDASLRKVEVGIFDRCIRGSEKPAGWVAEELAQR